MSWKKDEKVLVISQDNVDPPMPDPGIHCHETAQYPSASHSVNMGFFSLGNVDGKKFRRAYSAPLIDTHIEQEGAVNVKTMKTASRLKLLTSGKVKRAVKMVSKRA